MQRETDPIAAFSEALELGPSARAGYLDRLRGIDPGTADEVAALLASREDLGDFLEPTGPRPSISELFADPEDQLGRSIGSYRLKSVLGVGGMSVVYTAERADDRFSKTVAIKLVRASSDDELLRRIDRERRLLARLEHPNIARLLDSGEAEDGSPFIVMERVDGPPIDRYCDERRLDVESRVRLFVDVCSAVEHAHAEGVVHRDIKPSNVLVTRDGKVKLLDFGIAKAIESTGLGPAAEMTRTSATLLSPLYASPEQIAGARITPATDVYALGVVLYELLSGVHPYGGAKSVAEVLDSVRRSEPVAPSLASLNAPGPAVAARRVVARGLSRRLNGDLDNIILKAIHRDPSRRYRTAGELAEDLERHLSAHPVSARPDTLRYRFGKWIVRNRVAVAAGSVVLVILLVTVALSASQLLRFGLVGLLVAATATVTVLFLRADEARRTAGEFRAEAERAQVLAERVSGFLKEMLSSIDPEISQGRDTALLRDLLGSAARRIDEELGDQPEVAAEIHLILWRIYTRLAQHQESFHHARVAAELMELDPGSDLWFDAHIAHADSLAAGGDLDGAHRVLDRCGTGVSARNVDRQIDFFATSANLMSIRGDSSRAEEYLRQSVKAARQGLPPDSPLLAGQLQWLGRHLAVRGNKEEGELLLAEAMSILSADPGPLRVPYLRTVYTLAILWIEAGRAEEAEPMIRSALDRAKKVWGPQHLESALLTDVLGRVFEARGDTENAEGMYRRYLEIVTNLYKEGHRIVGSAWHELACFHLRMGRHEESAEEFHRAIEAYVATVGSASPLTNYSRMNQAALLLETGDPVQAEQLLRELLSLPDASRPNQPRSEQLTEFLLGASLVDQGNLAEGGELLRRHLDVLITEAEGSTRNVFLKIGRSRLERLASVEGLGAGEAPAGPAPGREVL